MSILQKTVSILIVVLIAMSINGQILAPSVAIAGTVKFYGKPVNLAYIQFTNDNDKDAIFSTKTDEKGRYELRLLAGKYKVFATGGPNPTGLVGFTPEFYKNDFLVTKKRNIRLNIVVDYIGEG